MHALLMLARKSPIAELALLRVGMSTAFIVTAGGAIPALLEFKVLS